MRKLKELFSDTLIYGISSVFARFINYLLVPLYTGVFEPEAYGIVGLVYAAIAFLNVIFTLGAESSYLRYAKNRETAPDYFKTLQLFLVATSVVLVLGLWLASGVITPLLGLSGNSSIFVMMLGILFFDTLSIVPFAELRIKRRPYLFAALKTGNVFINLGLNFYLILVLRWGIEAVFVSNLAASALTALVVWLFTLPLLRGSWNRDLLNQTLKFGLPFVPAGIGHVINEMLDRFFIKGMSPESILMIYGQEFNAEYLVGIYNACYKLAVFMLLLVQMYRMAWQPFFMRKSDEHDAPQLYAQAFMFFNVAAALVFLVVALFLDQIVAIKIPFINQYVIGKEYWMGLSVVPILLVAYWFQGWYVNFSAGIFIAEKTGRLAQITLMGGLVTIFANLLLIPHFGIMGSAAATLFSYMFMAMLIYHYSKKAYHVPYNLWKGFGVVGIAVTAVYLKPVLTEHFFPDIIAAVVLLLSSGVVISLLSVSDLLLQKKKN